MTATTRSTIATMPFRDRVDAGRRLGQALLPLRGGQVVVLGLPRGGVPVAAEVARALSAPLDVIVVRKLGVPSQQEVAMGAIGEGGVRIVNETVVHAAGVTASEFARAEDVQRVELDQRVRRIRGNRTHVPLTGQTAIIVDDGVATGSTALAACQVARALGARRVVLAVPVCAPGAIEELRRVADDVVCLETPAFFSGVSQWYQDFRPTTDAEVDRLLAESSDAASSGRTAVVYPVGTDREIDLFAGSLRLAGHLTVPEDALGLVVFAHGSGSSRHSPRNQAVAEVLNRAGLATVLFDLLTEDEERDRAKVFDIGLLGARLDAVTRWLRAEPEVHSLAVGYFGASTGAGAALWAAAEPGSDVRAVVSRGGRPDLAGPRLRDVRSPTLLIVGGRDGQVLELNQQAAAQMRCEHRVAVVPGATHLFEEPGTLQAASELARSWFLIHLTGLPDRTRARHGRGA